MITQQRLWKSKGAQLQIMENAFIILVIFVLLVMAFVFVAVFQRQANADKAKDFRELELIKKSRILNFLPEMQCSDNNNLDPDCYDILKIESFRGQLNSEAHSYYYRPLLGNIKLTIKRFDPSPDENAWKETWEVYDNPKPQDKGYREVQFPVLLKDVRENSNYFGVIYLRVYE